MAFEPSSDEFSVQHDRKGWYITRNIPVAIIAALAAQLAVAGWVASKYDSRISDQEARIVTIAQQTKQNADSESAVQQRLSNIEGKLEYIVQAVKTKDTHK